MSNRAVHTVSTLQ